MYQHIEKTEWLENYYTKSYQKIDKRFRNTPFINKLNQIMKDCFSKEIKLDSYSFKEKKMNLNYKYKLKNNEYRCIFLEFPQNYFEKKHNTIIDYILNNNKDIKENELLKLKRIKKSLSQIFKNEIKRLQRELDSYLDKDYHGNNCRPYPGIKYGMKNQYKEIKKQLNELQRMKEI